MPGFWPLIIQLWVEWSRVFTCGQTNVFYLLQNVQTGSGAYPDSCLVGTGALFCKWSSWGMEFTTQLHLICKWRRNTGCYHPLRTSMRVLRLRMSGALPLLHLYTFVAWKGITLYSPLPDCYQASSFPLPLLGGGGWLSHVCKFNTDRMKNKVTVNVPFSFWTLGWCISLHYQRRW